MDEPLYNINIIIILVLLIVSCCRVFGAIVFGAMGMGQGNSFAPDYAKAKAAAARIFNIIDREPEIDAFSTDGLKPVSYLWFDLSIVVCCFCVILCGCMYSMYSVFIILIC